MKQLILTTLLLGMTATATAQESHYQRALRGQDTDYGLVVDPPLSGVGMYWSRTRNVDDVVIVNETPEEAAARRQEFMRLCRLAYDAYDESDWRHTIIYGDSALTTRFHTPDLYFFMAIASEKIGFYEDAEWAYKKAADTGYIIGDKAYTAFKQRMKQRKAAEKQRKKAEKKKK